MENKVTLIPANLVEHHSQKQVTTSYKIAEVFGKAHKHVLRDIETLEIPEDLHKSNFGLMFITKQLPNNASRQDKYYEITKDGFSLLAMGYTGEKAMKFKIAFINAFNQMEQALVSQSAPAIDYSDQIASISDKTDRMMANLQFILNRMDSLSENLNSKLALPAQEHKNTNFFPTEKPHIQKAHSIPTDVNKPKRDLVKDKILMYCFRNANTMDDSRGQFFFDMAVAEAETGLSHTEIRNGLTAMTKEKIITYKDLGAKGHITVNSIKPLTQTEIQNAQRTGDSLFNKLFGKRKS